METVPSNAPPVAIKVVLVTTPSRCASRMPPFIRDLERLAVQTTRRMLRVTSLRAALSVGWSSRSDSLCTEPSSRDTKGQINHWGMDTDEEVQDRCSGRL